MSSWTYINGYVTVRVHGKGQRAKDFIVGSVIDHLPKVTGSEHDMHVEIVRRDGFNCSSNHDELGQWSNLGDSWLGKGIQHFEEQDTYDLFLEAALRDRYFDETFREFVKWMNRLSKRLYVTDMLVRISSWQKEYLFNGAGFWRNNMDTWSWVKTKHNKFHSETFEEFYNKRHSTNWRYGIVPFEGNWSELLINVLPGGNALAQTLDYYGGMLEPYEYEHKLLEYSQRCNAFIECIQNNVQNLCEYEQQLKASQK